MGHRFSIRLEITGELLTRYQYHFYPDFRDQNGHEQKELGQRLMKELPIPGGWDDSTISDHDPGTLYSWMGGLRGLIGDYDFQKVLKGLRERAEVAQAYITDAIYKAVIAKITNKD